MSDVPTFENLRGVATPEPAGRSLVSGVEGAPLGSDGVPTIGMGIEAPSVIFIEAPWRPMGDAANCRRSTALAACFLRQIACGAPAWIVSMVVHMAAMVTMAVVTVSEPSPHRPPRLLHVAAQEKKIEEALNVVHRQPTTLDERAATTTIVQPVEQPERPIIDPGEEIYDAARAVADPKDDGIDRLAKSILLSPMGSSAGVGFEPRSRVLGDAPEPREKRDEAGDAAVGRALQWLAHHQMPDGGWSFDHTAAPACHNQCRNPGGFADGRNAATGMVLLAFLGRGETHRDSQKYRATIGGGLNFLIQRMKAGPQGGSLADSGNAPMYSHGVAAVAICEAYAMSRDGNLLEPARAAADFICNAQTPIFGGWRCAPRLQSNTSVAGWQLMALKSAHMSGLISVPPEVSYRAGLFLDSVQVAGGAAYGYQSPGRGEAATAIGLLCRMHLGWKKDNSVLQRGVRILNRRGPASRNMCYNYYATQVMRHWGGEPWENWNRRLRDQLIHAQATHGHEDGSWFIEGGGLVSPTDGRLYCTAMAAMILEIHYRRIPLYQSQSIESDFPED